MLPITSGSMSYPLLSRRAVLKTGMVSGAVAALNSFDFGADPQAATPQILEDAPWSKQFKNPRPNAHFVGISPASWPDPMKGAEPEPVSPWYDVKPGHIPPMPKFEQIRDKLPRPIFDGHADAIETYWYAWKTFVDIWNYPPAHANNQAIANINGYPTWAGWGSSQVMDTAFMMYFARYGHHAYPFITGIDNAYARQHENGFICQESDNDNFEVYSGYPAMTPFLNAWMEWNYYQVSADADRLRRVLMPLVKNFEWFMTYGRRKSDGAYGMATPGLRDYSTDPFNETFCATALRAVETLAMARIARAVGRKDLEQFFSAEHGRLGTLINDRFWDAEHGLYNDRCEPNHMYAEYRDPKLAGRFVTELRPGVFNKCVWTFAPLAAEIVPADRIGPLAQLALDPKHGFFQPHGPATYSADSNPPGIAPGDTKSPYRQVWPPFPCIMQEGFARAGRYEVARQIATNYFDAIVRAYIRNKTINESLSPTTLDGWGQPNFCGFGGIGPIAIFIEYVLGLDVNAPENVVTWHVNRLERHGIANLPLGASTIDLLCEARDHDHDPPRVTARAEAPFTLRIIVKGQTSERAISKGNSTLQL